MNQIINDKHYDLEERTFKFARDCRDLVKKLFKNQHNLEYSKQLIRSSGSVASNYIEANESLSKKDFVMRIRICKKESKESGLWLKLIERKDEDKKERTRLLNESIELMKIFGSILEKCA